MKNSNHYATLPNMMKFIWDAKYSVNIKSIDTQHQQFFALINKIFFALSQRPIDTTEIKQIVTEFIKYAETHLAYEETKFQESQYPEAQSHCQFHDSYRHQIAEFEKQIKLSNADVPTIANQLAQFAQNWLSEHIMATDQKYSQFFLAHDIR